jgi:hypothetical protein
MSLKKENLKLEKKIDCANADLIKALSAARDVSE